ncbi:uncharacterized protein LOC114305660 [Camellia sinensis]|uniref:uncharacterized protein LOC114305660 n=1 Tax=Camellia sinensis TaxID=4442 RepID=UPI00103594CB|nr:uncharacterized protein LOC114305660 [Camellia sinensis]
MKETWCLKEEWWGLKGSRVAGWKSMKRGLEESWIGFSGMLDEFLEQQNLKDDVIREKKALNAIELFLISLSRNGRAGFILHRKLHALKLALKKWSKEVFGNVSEKIKEVECQLHSLDLLVEDRPLLEAEVKLKREVRSEMWRLSRMLEWELLQKSRLEWTLKGDKNTRFFHVMASSRQNRNAINSILVEERVVEDPEQVTQEQLEVEFLEEEIWAAVKECNENKAPGPDSFNFMCFQKNWKAFKEEVRLFMKEFYNVSRLAFGMNSSFITLIPVEAE